MRGGKEEGQQRWIWQGRTTPTKNLTEERNERKGIGEMQQLWAKRGGPEGVQEEIGSGERRSEEERELHRGGGEDGSTPVAGQSPEVELVLKQCNTKC